MKKLQEAHEPLHNIVIVGIQSPNNPLKNIESYFEEFRNLVTSSGRAYQHEIYLKLRSIDPAHYITKGKLSELIDMCKQHNITEVIISEPLSTAQERTLHEMLQCSVVDRTGLILDIFERGAHSAEGKKQVALARFQHEKARLAGRGASMSQQAGRIGTRGPGETAKEKETQHIERMMSTLKNELEKLKRTRETQRKKRVTSRLPLLCLIGYTNAGKSTILNALTKSNVLAENKLFSTLDTTTRELYIDGHKKALISDTVGFIQQLPHHLIEAFKSTLAELEYAHLLLHVVDISDPNWEEHCLVVHNVLKELSLSKPMLYIFNKIDKVENTKAVEAKIKMYQPHVIVSALTMQSLEPLIDFLKNAKLESQNS